MYATILVVNKKKGVASDYDGVFDFPVNDKDTVRITSIGYDPIEFTISPELIARHPNGLYIQMKPGVYELDSVVVTNLSEDFYLRKKKGEPIDMGFVDPNAPKRDWTKPQAELNGGLVISGLLTSLDKKVKERRQLNLLLAAKAREEDRKAKADAKFNREFVKQVTRIDDRVIDEFMEYCDFRESEIIATSEYALAVKILRKYDQFLRR